MDPEQNPDQDQKQAQDRQRQLLGSIEAAFASADRTNLRKTTRFLEQRIAEVSNPVVRARYLAALDSLPDMVQHTIN